MIPHGHRVWHRYHDVEGPEVAVTHKTLGLVIVTAIVTAACSGTSNSTPPRDDIATPASTTSTTATTLTNTPSSSEAPAVCEPLREVVDADAEASLRMNEFMLELFAVMEQQETTDQATETRLLEEFRRLVHDLAPGMDQVVESYDAALTVAPTELIDDLVALRESSLLLWALMVEAIDTGSTFEQFDVALEQLSADPEFNEAGLAAGTAAVQLDQYTIPECGFKLSAS